MLKRCMSQLRGHLQPSEGNQTTGGTTVPNDCVIYGCPSVEKLRDELERLMLEHIESMQKQTFLGI